MSDTFLIERTFMRHNGGTKFYQTLRFVRVQTVGGVPGTWGVAAFHYGSNKVLREGNFTRPVVGGQVEIKRDDFRNIYQAKSTQKQKDGYLPIAQGPKTEQPADDEAFRGRVIELMGAKHAWTIFDYMGMTGDQPEPEPQNTPIEEIDPATMPESWGAW